MRCEFCRDPGYIPEAISICRDCAPRFAAMEDVAEKALAWAKTHDDDDGYEKMIALDAACAALAKLREGSK